MKRFLSIIPVIILGCIFTLTAEETTPLSSNFERANALYSEGEYMQAAHLYEQILNEEGISPELYYNLGNAYFKSNELGRAILNYERALQLDHKYSDAIYNLQLAEAKVIDNITQEQPFFVKRWFQVLTAALTSNQWLYLSWGLFIISLAGGLFFVFGTSKNLRKTSFSISLVLFILCVFSFSFSISRKNQLTNKKEAIVMPGIIPVKSSPDRNGTDLFELHEGTKVSVSNKLGDWCEIMIGDGRIGWIQTKQIEEI